MKPASTTRSGSKLPIVRATAWSHTARSGKSASRTTAVGMPAVLRNVQPSGVVPVGDHGRDARPVFGIRVASRIAFMVVPAPEMRITTRAGATRRA